MREGYKAGCGFEGVPELIKLIVTQWRGEWRDLLPRFEAFVGIDVGGDCAIENVEDGGVHARGGTLGVEGVQVHEHGLGLATLAREKFGERGEVQIGLVSIFEESPGGGEAEGE